MASALKSLMYLAGYTAERIRLTLKFCALVAIEQIYTRRCEGARKARARVEVTARDSGKMPGWRSGRASKVGCCRSRRGAGKGLQPTSLEWEFVQNELELASGSGRKRSSSISNNIYDCAGRS